MGFSSGKQVNRAMSDKEQQLLDALIREVALNGGSVAAGLSAYIEENFNTPLEHTRDNPPGQLWKESHYSLLGKV